MPRTVHVLRETIRAIMSAGPLASTERVQGRGDQRAGRGRASPDRKVEHEERRARHEVAAKHQFYDDMGFDSAVLTMDWKTKVGRAGATAAAIDRAGAHSHFLTTSPHPPSHHYYHQFLFMMHSESMVDYFGKKGTPLASTYLVVHNVHGVMHIRRRYRPSLTPLSIRLLSDATTPTTTLERWRTRRRASYRRPSSSLQAGTTCCGACGRASTANRSMGPWLTSLTVSPPPCPTKAKSKGEGGEGSESGGGGGGGDRGGGSSSTEQLRQLSQSQRAASQSHRFWAASQNRAPQSQRQVDSAGPIDSIHKGANKVKGEPQVVDAPW